LADLMAVLMVAKSVVLLAVVTVARLVDHGVAPSDTPLVGDSVAHSDDNWVERWVAPLVACWEHSAVVNSAERSVAHLADLRVEQLVVMKASLMVEHWVVTTVDHSVESKVGD
jgi:hypothetical protein